MSGDREILNAKLAEDVARAFRFAETRTAARLISLRKSVDEDLVRVRYRSLLRMALAFYASYYRRLEAGR